METNSALRNQPDELEIIKKTADLHNILESNVRLFAELCDRSGIDPRRAYIACLTSAAQETDIIMLHRILTQILEAQYQKMKSELKNFLKNEPSELFRLAEKTGFTPDEIVEIIRREESNPMEMGRIYNSMLSRLSEKNRAVLAANQIMNNTQKKSKAM